MIVRVRCWYAPDFKNCFPSIIFFKVSHILFHMFCSVKKSKIMQQILFSIVNPNIQHKKSLQRIGSTLIKASLYQKKTENILLIQNILHLNDKLQ